MKKLAGIFPPIPTPFERDEISFDRLEQNMRRWNQTALSGYVVLGSNGESVFLTHDEKLKLTEAVRKFASIDKLLIAGTGSESIKETISLTNRAADLGADYALIVTPSYYKSEMKHEAFLSYFMKVADAVTVPVILYNVPKFTGVDMQVETVVQLAGHGNIAGIKNSAENIRQLTEFAAAASEEFTVLAGTASVLYSGLTAGASGGILALANIAPAECVRILSLTDAGEHREALALQRRLIPANTAVTSLYGVAGLKAAMDLLGYFGGDPRAPLTPLGNGERKRIKTVLGQSALL